MGLDWPIVEEWCCLTGSTIVLFQENRLKCFMLIELGRHTVKERQDNFF